MKKFLILLVAFLEFGFCFAKTAVFQSENYNLTVTYNETLVPGDAVFVRMEISTPKNHKKSKNDSEKKGALQLYKDKTVIEKSNFYSVGKKKNSQTYADLLCGVPASAWLTSGNYSLKVIFTFSDDETIEFTLPLVFKSRTFNKEVLELDESNTAIKTDTSPERLAQINKLNDILFTSLANDVYTLKPFTSPTSSTRYTAYYGDRREYVYTNGKKSQDMHNGNDYGVPEGTEVRACADGRVVMAENRISTGWSIVIEHLPGLYSLYYHLSKMDVKEGDMVKQGDLIGKSGSTGLATGPHLHWEMRLNGSAVRPEFFLQDFTFDQE
ncbi:MAG: M23 family metallopeptidase [Treponema sp.]|nr:M23 family metallopeptidase [Treponema sp.]